MSAALQPLGTSALALAPEEAGSGATITLAGNNCTQTATSGAAAITVTPPVAGTVNLIGSNCTQTATSGTGAVTVTPAGTGSFTLPALKNNTGTLLANESGITVYVYSVVDGSLVVTKTGQTTNASGVMTVSDAAIVSATQYRVVIVMSGGAEGMDKVTAA